MLNNYKNSYVIIENRIENNKSYNKLRKYLNDLNLNELSLNEGIINKINHKFLWFRYINSIDKNILSYYEKINVYLTNEILGIECITNKYKLYDNMKNNFTDSYLNFMPYSFKLTKDTKYEKDTIFITRPVNIIKINYPANSGLGILVYDNEETLEIAKKKLDEYDIIVSSKYITNPLLFNGKKFHLRCHLFITIINNKLSGHIFNKYKMYFAKEKYINSNFQNKDIHDSHYIPNIKNYYFPDDFNKETINNINFNDSIIEFIYKQIREIAKKITSISSKNAKIPKNSVNTFHLIGFDIMIDNNLNVFLLECNRFSNIKYGYDNNFLDIFWDWFNHIILKPTFLNDNTCDLDAVYISEGNYR
jgi:hypothetical protein